jgi:AcrR family transcriptional regulator
MRADAARNRERILVAARDVFLDEGGQAPLDEIARRAGIGNATLYRHFPDRDALIHGVVLAVTDRIAARARAALDEEADPYEGLRRFVIGAMTEQIGALCPMLAPGFDRSHPELLAARARVEDAAQELIDRAQHAGQLRGDVAVADLFIAVSQLGRPLPGTECRGLGPFMERHVQIFLDGLRAPARSELPGTPATWGDIGIRQHA